MRLVCVATGSRYRMNIVIDLCIILYAEIDPRSLRFLN